MELDMAAFSLVTRVVLVLVLLPVLFVGASLAWNHPPLFDAPGWGARLKIYFTTHIAETQENHPFPELRLRTFDVSPDLLLAFSVQAIDRLGWQLSSQQTDPYILTAVATTRLWQFKDDITLRVYAAPEGRSILYVKSESRIGKGDLGANLRRVINLTEEITHQVMESKGSEKTIRSR